MKLLLSILGTLIVLQTCLASSVKLNDQIQKRITKVLEPKIQSLYGEKKAVAEKRLSQFREFVREFERSYDSENEIEDRYAAFVKNMDISDKLHRAEKGTAEYGMTKFSDYLEHELRRITGGCSMREKEFSAKESAEFQELVDVGNYVLNHELSYKDTPKSFDWRTKGYISPVIDQGYCSSSWAYAATTALETANAVETNKFERLSKQQLIDCDRYNWGCCGGRPHMSYFYIAAEDGIELDKTYNGRRFVTKCHFKRPQAKVHVHGLTVFSNTSVTVNEKIMEQYVAQKGSIAININPLPLLVYKKGIIGLAPDDCDRDTTFIVHSVTLVGYGEEDGKKYWIAKNSFGKKWGEKGYFRILRGENVCGLALYGVAPITKPPPPPHPHDE